MGRKAKFIERAQLGQKKGPGKKAKKQKDPVFIKALTDNDTSDKTLSRKQKQRAIKRTIKQEAKKIKHKETAKTKPQKKVNTFKPEKYNSDESEESEDEENEENDSDIEEEESETEETPTKQNGYTDDNSSWLKPKTKKQETDSEEEEDDEEDDDESDDEQEVEEEDEGEEESEEEDCKVGTLDDIDEDESEDEVEQEESAEEEESDKEEEEDSSDDDSDDEDMLPIEKDNVKLKKKQKEEDDLAEEELQSSMAQQGIFSFPEEDEEEGTVSLQDVQQRIRDIIVVLSDFSKLREANRSRSEYTDLLKKDLCTYYSYNGFLMDRLMQLFPVSELLEFLEASEVQRPLTIRTNTLKTRRRDLAHALINRGVNLDPVGKWTKVGLVIYSSQVPVGATPEYLAGHYLIQGASSFLPVMALAPQENERILDMCSAPGGKSSHIAAIMKNTGMLFANDANRDRVKAIVGNFHRLGIVNSVISCMDGRGFPNTIKGFDRVLLDAPCTGTGVAAKDPTVKTNKDEIDVQRCFTLQRQLLLAAIDSLSAKSQTGGYLVYSTCSVLPEENESVVDYALKKRNVKLVPTGLDFGTEGFVSYRQNRYHSTMKLTRRFYPHTHNMDGFFVAKFKKFSDIIPKAADMNENEHDTEEAKVEDKSTKDKSKKTKKGAQANNNQEKSPETPKPAKNKFNKGKQHSKNNKNNNQNKKQSDTSEDKQDGGTNTAKVKHNKLKRSAEKSEEAQHPKKLKLKKEFKKQTNNAGPAEEPMKPRFEKSNKKFKTNDASPAKKSLGETQEPKKPKFLKNNKKFQKETTSVSPAEEPTKPKFGKKKKETNNASPVKIPPNATPETKKPKFEKNNKKFKKERNGANSAKNGAKFNNKSGKKRTVNHNKNR